MRSARASRPPLRVAAESSRIARTVRRIVFSGRRRYSTKRALEQFGVGRHAVGRPRRRLAGRAEVAVDVEDRGEHPRPRRPVDGGVVDLGQLGDQPAVVDPFDHVELPQRLAPVEGPGLDAADHLAELFGSAGRRHGVMADVEVDVEVGVLDPVRQVQPERHLDQPAPERGELVDALEDQLLGRFQPRAARCAARVVQVERRDVAEHAGRLHVEEAGVDPRQLLHGGMLRRLRGGGWRESGARRAPSRRPRRSRR